MNTFPDTPRLQFLKSLGLKYDPFASAVAENEVDFTDDIPEFYTYYHPTIFAKPNQKKDIRFLFNEQSDILIFGEPGSGKTTLRFILEAESRTKLDNTFVVSYLLDDKLSGSTLSIDEHARRLSRAIALDLLIQVIEQFNPYNPFPTDEQIRLLQKQLILIQGDARRLFELILENSIPNARAGIGAYWAGVRRPAVQYVPRSEMLLKLIQILRESLNSPPVTSKSTQGKDLVFEGLAASRAWGFKRALILVDGVDTWQRTPKNMLMLIEHLLDFVPLPEKEKAYFRLFLPLDLKGKLMRLVSSRKSLQSRPILPIIISWHEDALRELLAQRFRAAGSNIISFDVLAERNSDISKNLILISNGSPRRLLKAAGSLLDFYLARKPEASRINAQDWERMQSQWRYE